MRGVIQKVPIESLRGGLSFLGAFFVFSKERTLLKIGQETIDLVEKGERK
jgi:hypothetical protein